MADPFKTALRNSIKQVRSKLSDRYQSSSSLKICNKIKKLDQYRKAKHIALYRAINGEVSLSSLWNSAPLQGKYCYYPALNSDQSLLFLPATPATPFKKNHYGILEPDVPHDLARPVPELDLIIVPLLVFDSQCNRLGMGSGYYDRALQNKGKGLFIGVAYEFQRTTYLQTSPWDIPMDAIVTPEVILYHPREGGDPF